MKKKSKKNKLSNLIFMGFLMALISIFVDEITQKPLSNSTNKSLNSVLNEMNKIETIEQFNSYARKNKIEDTEISGAAVLMSFSIQAKVIGEFCDSTGYIPEKHISALNSYITDIDVDKLSLNALINRGHDREKSIQVVQKIKEETQKQLKRFMEIEYLEEVKTNPHFTKKAYCKTYDDRSEDIISMKLNKIKEDAPKIFEKYFIKK